MLRQSIAPQKASQMSSASAVAKLLEKKKEYDAVCALERASALCLERIQGLGEDCDIMANAGEVHGQVLAQWPKMFQILAQLVSVPKTRPDDHHESASASSINEEERLVRIPIEELQEVDAEKATFQ